MLTDHILTLITFVPTAGAIVVAFLPRKGRAIPAFTLLVTLATFVLSLHLPAHFNYALHGFQFEENQPWIASPAIRYHLGVDGLSLWLIVLATFLGPIGVLVSWRAIDTHTKEFYFLFLLQQTAMIGVFAALDLFLYYGFWELSLVPMAILIAMFGPNRGRQAAIKFFLYTFIPSALFLVAILYLYAKAGTFDFARLQYLLASGDLGIAPHVLSWLSLAFLVAFAVKVPVFPLHGWLSDVIQEAPVAMAMVVAGKLGLYSIFRFNLGLFPAQARAIAPLMIILAVIGILYGALVALAQTDMKRLIAYSILGNLSFCILGIFCFAIAGLNGAVFQTLNEGLTGSALLVLVSFLYERYRTYDMSLYGGLAARLPMLATLFVVTSLALIGLPLFNGFVGEFLVLSGSFPVHPAWVAAATTGVILSASYMLWMVQRIFYGKQSSLVLNRPAFDLDFREHITLWPMAILMLTMGVLSPYWIKGIQTGILQFPIDVTQTTVVAQRHAHGFVSTHMLPAPTPADAQKLMGGVQ
ncbi:MAG TPA: NADH-quinone oxidoreductase subunit M [Acidobacteriaceae bacterium]|nr:NADH-quinone oxidoreductase subunit M [Acidobacteriaceae bacterium]